MCVLMISQVAHVCDMICDEARRRERARAQRERESRSKGSRSSRRQWRLQRKRELSLSPPLCHNQGAQWDLRLRCAVLNAKNIYMNLAPGTGVAWSGAVSSRPPAPGPAVRAPRFRGPVHRAPVPRPDLGSSSGGIYSPRALGWSEESFRTFVNSPTCTCPCTYVNKY